MIDKGAEGCGAVSCAGWAVLSATWQVFGAESVSQVADKGWGSSTSDKVWAGIGIVTLGKGKAVAKAAEGTVSSFRAPKRVLGPAGEGKQWHHIVEQSQVGQFGPEAIHSVDNVVAIPREVHQQISGFYSSKPAFAQGQTVRNWLRSHTFEEQTQFGIGVLRRFGDEP